MAPTPHLQGSSVEWQNAAAHRKVATYRLRKFSELTGHDLTSTADLAQVWLALTAAGHLTP